MNRFVGLWLVGCALCGTPVAADEDMYDGPTAIRPLTVTRQPQHSAPPNTVCDFQHQCYPEQGGPAAPAPLAPPPIASEPIAPRPQFLDQPIVAMWRDCMDRALVLSFSRPIRQDRAPPACLRDRRAVGGDGSLAGQSKRTDL